MDTQVSVQIRQRRESLKLSMRAAAKLAGVSPTAWSALEAGKHPPTTTTQRRVALALQWPIDWLDRVAAGEGVEVNPPPDEVAVLRGLVADLSDRVVTLEQQLEALTDAVAERSSAPRVPAPRSAPQGS